MQSDKLIFHRKEGGGASRIWVTRCASGVSRGKPIPYVGHQVCIRCVNPDIVHCNVCNVAPELVHARKPVRGVHFCRLILEAKMFLIIIMPMYSTALC